MSKERPQLKLKANVPTAVTFCFDSPIEVSKEQSKYGKEYDVWTVEVDGVEHGLLASNGLRAALRDFGPSVGDVLVITKTEKEQGKGFDYSVLRAEGAGASEAQEPPQSGPADRGDREPGQGGNGRGEKDLIAAYTARYVGVCKELSRQWPELHEKDPELFRSAVGCVFIQVGKARA